MSKSKFEGYISQKGRHYRHETLVFVQFLLGQKKCLKLKLKLKTKLKMRARNQPLAGAEGVDSDVAAPLAPHASRTTRASTQSNNANMLNPTISKTECSPVRGSAGGGAASGGTSGNGTGQVVPKIVATTPPVPARTSVAKGTSGGIQTRGGKGSGPNLTAPPSGGPGRTPQTRRKELTLQQPGSDNRYTSPSGSPRTSNAPRVNSGGVPALAAPPTTQTTKRSRRQAEAAEPITPPVRKTSTSSLNNNNNRGSTGKSSRKSSSHPHSRSSPPASLDPDAVDRSAKLVHRERTKFDGLWDSKSIEHGLVRIPTHRLEELIRAESIDKFYDVEEKPVASGLFATVRKCTHRESGVMYAGKFSSRVRCGVDCSMEILHEIAMLSACAESNRIVHLKDVFQNRHEIILVLEYAPGGDFQSVLDEDMVPFEEDVQGFLRQILEALEFIHDRNIAHLDIKPQNIVLMGQFPNCEIKLCDLEVARVIQEDEDIREIIGTPDYVAPEILTLEPISLAADIWSLGVVAYVLLTGFSPFGGDTDQETLRNITSAELDFPDELFEGVSEEAKHFVAMCLDRDPKKRPTVKECLQHDWLAQEQEPPSPSPLMLKIPAPDPIPDPIYHSPGSHSGHHSLSGAGHFGGSGSAGGSNNSLNSRRSCQTCRDKITERKRYLSKSREAIFEKVANSNLKKSLSKSRERLCDMRLTLSKSRDHLNDTKTAAVRSQDRLFGFRCLSKSQEVISSSLGGTMKRMVNGAVSDITHAFMGNPALFSSTVDVVIIPDGAVLLSNPSAADLLGVKSTSLSPISESAMSLPAILKSGPTSPTSGLVPSEIEVVSPAIASAIEPLIEVSEEEEDSNRAVSVDRAPNKEEKENQNYETRLQSLSRSASVDDIGKRFKEEIHQKSGISPAKSTLGVSIGVQVNLSKSISSPSLRRRLAERADLYTEEDMADNNNVGCDVTSRQTKEPRRRGFSHDHTLGEEKQSYAWRQELDKIRSQKHLRVTELIGTFNRSKTPETEDEAAVKQRRRASLQIQFDSPAFAQLSSSDKDESQWLKAQRRKSTSSLLSNNIENLKIQEQITEILNAQKNLLSEGQEENQGEEKCDAEKNIDEKSDSSAKTSDEPVIMRKSLMDKVAQRKKNWDYFEIDHPKAISDQRLEQLKVKYLRRRTENDFTEKNKRIGIVEEIEEENEPVDELKKVEKPQPAADPSKVAHRSQSVPVFTIGPPKQQAPPSAELELSVDPLTGLCLDPRKPGFDENDETETDVQMRKLSSDSDSSGSRRSSRSSRRRSSHLADIQEQQSFIPEEKFLEVRIDPLTSQVETLEVARTILPKKLSEAKVDSEKRRRLSVEITLAGTFRNQLDDDGFGSLPHTPTELSISTPISVATSSLVVSHNTRLDDGIFTSSEEVLDDNSLPPNSTGDTRQKTSSSLDGDRERGSVISWGEEIRPASAQANPVSRMCTGAFSRALVRLGGESHTTNVADNGLRRRQSSPVFRVSQT